MSSDIGVEKLMIYRQYMELIYYTLMILHKFPRVERNALNADIRRTTYEGLECLLYAYKVYDKKQKLTYLHELDIKLKFIKALVRVSYRQKYINHRNYGAWSKKLFHLGNLLGGWIVSCQKP